MGVSIKLVVLYEMLTYVIILIKRLFVYLAYIMSWCVIQPGDCLSHQHHSSVEDNDGLMSRRPSGKSAAPASQAVSGTRRGVPSALRLPGESLGSSPPPPGTAPPPPYSPGSRPPPQPRLQHQL